MNDNKVVCIEGYCKDQMIVNMFISRLLYLSFYSFCKSDPVFGDTFFNSFFKFIDLRICSIIMQLREKSNYTYFFC